MFGKKKTGVQAILGKGVVCEGDFAAEGSARIDGTVNGNVSAKGRIIIGPNGVVKGYVTAESAIIGGCVEGSVKAPDRIELTPSAKIGGDLACKVLVVDEGAFFNGRCYMKDTDVESFNAAENDDSAAEKLKTEQGESTAGQNPAQRGEAVDQSQTAANLQEAEAAEKQTETQNTEEKKPRERKSAKSAFMKAMREMEESKKKQKEDDSEEE